MFQVPLTDQPKVQAQTLAEKLSAAEVSGSAVEFTAEEAAQVGAFPEDALSEQEAVESSLDRPESSPFAPTLFDPDPSTEDRRDV
jgi:hypothetical protein